MRKLLVTIISANYQGRIELEQFIRESEAPINTAYSEARNIALGKIEKVACVKMVDIVDIENIRKLD